MYSLITENDVIVHMNQSASLDPYDTHYPALVVNISRDDYTPAKGMNPHSVNDFVDY